MRLALPLAVLATLQFTSSAVFAVPPGGVRRPGPLQL